MLLDKQGRTDEALDVLRLAVDRGLEDDYIRTTRLRLERKVSSPV